MKITYAKNPVEINPICPEFSGSEQTNFAGLLPFTILLLETLDFPRLLYEHVDLGMGRNCRYQDVQIFALIICGYLCGYARLKHFEQLSRDPMLQKRLGLEGPIDEDTLARRVKTANFFRAEAFSRVTAGLARQVASAGKRTGGPRWIDFDSSPIGVYGHQQGAAKGFNPGQKGQKSYHPLMAFASWDKSCLHSWWRPGNAYTGNGAADFFAETMARLPDPGADYIIRADSGFFAEALLSAIEAAGQDYLIKVKLKNLKPLLAGQSWESVPGQPELEYCEFTYQCTGWEAPRRMVGVRRIEEVLTEGVLFPRYTYQWACYVTTLDEAPLQLHALYTDRGECENWIQAIKGQLGAGTAVTSQFWANDLLWQLGVLAYNLSLWLRQLTHAEAAFRQEPRTFREWFVRVAGQLSYHARQYTLTMPPHYPERTDWQQIYQRLSRLQL